MSSCGRSDLLLARSCRVYRGDDVRDVDILSIIALNECHRNISLLTEEYSGRSTAMCIEGRW